MECNQGEIQINCRLLSTHLSKQLQRVLLVLFGHIQLAIGHGPLHFDQAHIANGDEHVGVTEIARTPHDHIVVAHGLR